MGKFPLNIPFSLSRFIARHWGRQGNLGLSEQFGAGNMDVFVWDLARKNMTRITHDPAPDDNPVWTRDGKGIIFDSLRERNPGVCLKSAYGPGSDTLIRPTSQISFPGDWSSDGKHLLVQEATSDSQFYIGALSMEKDHDWRKFGYLQ
jgi:Tol biopolymer transport system component